MKEMVEAYARDYREKARIDELRRQIEAFLADPPSRAHRHALGDLASAASRLRDDSDHIVQAWN